MLYYIINDRKLSSTNMLEYFVINDSPVTAVCIGSIPDMKFQLHLFYLEEFFIQQK